MYRISTQKRKYSTTPIVRVTVGADGREQEEMILLVTGMPKKEGDRFSEELVAVMNKSVFSRDIVSIPWYERMEIELRNGATLQALKIYKDNMHCSLQEGKEFIMSIKDKYQSK
jgi:hypothetical protein